MKISFGAKGRKEVWDGMEDDGYVAAYPYFKI